MCLEAQTLAKKQSSFKVFFITQIGHGPGASNSNCSKGETRSYKKKQGRIMTLPEPHKKQLLHLFSANDIVSYREFISSPFYIHLK